MKKARICVVGACMLDLISYVPRLPKLGETLHGSRFRMGFGGKGANQAVMAARLGGHVTMVAKLGTDVFGRDTLENFKSNNIDTRHVLFTEKAFSGVAPISVDANGNNAIVIVSGANACLTVAEIEAARADIATADILVCQLEVPLEISLAAMRIAKEEGVSVIFNPAPAVAELPEELYRLSDIFCPNESETELLTGMPSGSEAQAVAAGKVLLERGAVTVIITRGEQGSLMVSREKTEMIPAVPVTAVDTTGAGDAFVGSLAFLTASGCPLSEAVSRANRIAAISVQSPGTQTGFPQAKDLPDELLV